MAKGSVRGIVEYLSPNKNIQFSANLEVSNRTSCKLTTDAHHSPTLVEGNGPLSLLVRLVTTRLYNDVIQESHLVYGDHAEYLNINV